MSDFIQYAEEARVWMITTTSTSYAVHLTAGGRLINLHWGSSISLADAVQLAGKLDTDWVGGAETAIDGIEEYPVEGGLHYREPSLAVRFADRTRGLELRFSEAEIIDSATTLRLHFVDEYYPLRVTLNYRAIADCGVIERWVDLRQDGGGYGEIEILVSASAAWTIPFLANYRMSHLHGHWYGENRLDRAEIAPGSSFLINSRTGTTGHFANPWFAVDDGNAQEDSGRVWSGALAWSGSWTIAGKRFSNGKFQVSGGAGQDGFRTWLLTPEQPFTTPVFAGVYSARGFGEMSRSWHEYLCRRVLPCPGEVRPILYNSWEATRFGINEENQVKLAEIASRIGVELFVMDDGWFKGRSGDSSGLGDWTPDPGRFPNGLSPVIDEVHELGMKFGLWIEPEMVNPDSDLYRSHPDWVYHYENRRRSESRNQLVLNLARADVAEWVHAQVDGLLRRQKIDYIKWDMNRPLSEAGWPMEKRNPERVWIDHVTNLYAIVDRLREDHPHVAFEMCSGGGGRVDIGMLARSDVVWASDNTDGLDRLAIQNGFTQIYPPRVMLGWVTDDHLNRGATPLRWRFHVAMAGVLGVGGDLLGWPEERLNEAAQHIDSYKAIRSTVQQGLLYRLEAPGAGDRRTAVQYVARDRRQTVVIAWLHAQQFRSEKPPLRLRGLEPDAVYELVGDGGAWSGVLLMNHGIDLPLTGDFDSRLLHFVRR
ncbi:alpha-galactosidase [Saccharopolyspora sp. ASAGF58]|uniref:alpha-galactosidase n=1 Tax=Saccharopolyspora sp. ASAGF58 TaxID=2719023 RepID=UPI00143FD14B|nr:alpha-galactosidase [Saccharopolyspora sp. ASAGF58]QIZ37839.1 alpha-galactosidase [Saccharopolyspora sp. ASAGF58]